MLNNGHTLQTSLEGKNTLTIDGKEFVLKQFHFHTPSENHVDGKEYPLEAHFVHADKAGHLAVVAVFFKLGNENPDLAKLLQNIPNKDHDVAIKVPFDADALIPSDKDYYRFNGSLTTPPCSEGVRWLVIKDTKTISPEQVKEFAKAMGHNNRPIQPLKCAYDPCSAVICVHTEKDPTKANEWQSTCFCHSFSNKRRIIPNVTVLASVARMFLS